MISKLSCQNYPILGDLLLDFCKEDGIPYKNIVLIGENGCGKSTILRLISNHFAGGRLENSTIECVKQNGEKDNISFVFSTQLFLSTLTLIGLVSFFAFQNHMYKSQHLFWGFKYI